MRTRTLAVGLAASLLMAIGLIPAAPRAAGQTTSTVTVAPGCGPKGGQGLILYQSLAPFTPQAGLKADLVVATPGGQQIGRIGLPDPPYGVFPMVTSCRVLVKTSGDQTYLVDPAAGRARRMALPGDLAKDLYPPIWWRRDVDGGRWAFLGTAAGQRPLLVDLETAAVTDLSGAIGDARLPLIVGQIAPRDDAVLLDNGVGTWLVPTANPKAARRLSDDPVVGSASFSEDGRAVLYSRSGTSGTTEVVLERLDGSNREIVATGGKQTRAGFVPGQGGRQFVVARPGKLSLLSLADRGERDLLSVPTPGFLSGLTFSADGRHLLLGYTADDGPTWTLVDLASGAVTKLPALNGMRAYAIQNRRVWRWLLFVPQNLSGPGVAGETLLGLDLASGATHAVFTTDSSAISYLPTNTSADGKLTLLTVAGRAGDVQLWLLDAATGRSRRLTRFGSGALSPDGRRVVVSDGNPVKPDPSSARLLLVDTEGTAVTPLGTGLSPVWVPLVLPPEAPDGTASPAAK